MIREKGAVASWWSFRIRDEANSSLECPFYLYFNVGGGQFPVRARIDEWVTSPAVSGLKSPWPDITFSEERDKTRGGEEQSRVFRTWLKISAFEHLHPPARLIHFSPATGLSTTSSLLNQNAFGYAYADVDKIRSPRLAELPAKFDSSSSSWNERDGVEQRVRAVLERSCPNESIRVEALRFFAFAIENADEERNDCWYLRETKYGLQLVTGRRPAIELVRAKLRVSVMGPVNDEVRAVLGAEIEDDIENKRIPGSLVVMLQYVVTVHPD
jgi:hypothetical protein